MIMGTDISAAFMDGHVSGIDQDYIWNDPTQNGLNP